jgi:hypothetical protein
LPTALLPPARQSLPDIAMSPGRLRLKAPDGPWPTTDEVAASAARIFLPSEGTALRTIITGRAKHQTSVIISAKAKKRLYVEGRAEKAYARLNEVTPSTVDQQTQPMRIECVVDGQRYVQIVDFIRELDTGEIEVIEVKRSERDIADPDYRRKLAVTGAIASGLGWIPRVVLHTEMFESRLHEMNVNRAYSARFTSVSDRQHQAIVRLRQAGQREIEIAELQSLFGCPAPAALSVAFALMVRREIAIDLTAPITPQSVACVLPTPQPPSGKIKVN